MRPLTPFALAAMSATSALAQPRTTTGTLLVANQQSASATIVDVATRATTTIDVGIGPHETVISPDGRWGIVTIYGLGGAPGNTLAVVDLAEKKVARTIDLGEYMRPHGASFLPGSSSRVVVTSEATQNVVLVDIAQGKVLGAVSTRHPGSHMLGVTADGKHVFTSNVGWGGISEIDLATMSFARDLQVSAQTEGVAVAPDGSTVWLGANQAGTVSVIDTKSWSIATTLNGLGMPYRIGISPDGSTAVICDPKDDKIHIADVRQRKITGEIASLGSPRGVKIAPDNRTAFITLGAQNAVAAVDLVDRTVLWKVPVGASPDGVWYGPTPR
jgi:DNA-binding beta-propeller fold protein YncE